MPLSRSSRRDFCSSLAANTAVKLSAAVKSEVDCLPVGCFTALSASSPVSSLSLPCPVSPLNVSSKQELPGHQTALVSTGDSWSEQLERDLLGGVDVKQEPLSPADDTARHSHVDDTAAAAGHMTSLTPSAHGDCQPQSSGSGLLAPSAVTSVSSQTAAAESMADEVTVADVKRESDNSPTAAAADAAAGDGDDVHVTTSLSLTVSSEASQLTVTSPTESSHQATSASLVMNTSASVRQELIKCRDSFGRTYYIPCRMLQQVRSSASVNCTKPLTECSLPATCCTMSAPPRSTSIASVTVSSHGGKSLSSVCDVIAKPVIIVKTEQQPSLTTTKFSFSDCVTNSSTSCHTMATVALPLSAQGTLSLSCSSHASVLTNTVTTSRPIHRVCLMTKPRPSHSMLNNALVKPRPLVPLSSVNSPTRSLPHITVLPSVSPVLMSTSHSVMPVSNIVTARLPTSSNPPMCLVIDGNNRVKSGNSRAVKEVVLVPGTNDATVKGIKMCNVPAASGAGVKGRCSGMLSASLSQRDGVMKVLDSSVLSPAQSVVCVTSLDRARRPAQPPRSAGQISLLRPQNVALSMSTAKPSSAEPKTQPNRTSLSGSNVIAKIGNQTVIVDVGNLSSSGLAAVKPSVTSVASVCSTKLKDTLVSQSACSEQAVSSLCGNVPLQSSAPHVHVAADMLSLSTPATDDVVKHCGSTIRYFLLFAFFIFT